MSVKAQGLYLYLHTHLGTIICPPQIPSRWDAEIRSINYWVRRTIFVNQEMHEYNDIINPFIFYKIYGKLLGETVLFSSRLQTDCIILFTLHITNMTIKYVTVIILYQSFSIRLNHVYINMQWFLYLSYDRVIHCYNASKITTSRRIYIVTHLKLYKNYEYVSKIA